MAAGAKRLIGVALLLVVTAAGTVATQPAPRQSSEPRRIVSLVPNVTEMLFAIGAGTQVVGVSSYDSFPPEVQKLPRVGALLDPDTERILALRPDLAILYGSQTDLQAQLSRAGIPTYMYRHGGVDTIFQTMRALGGVTGHQDGADRIARDLRMKIGAVRAAVKGRPHPRVLLVIERQPKTLREIYASGGRGFLHEMLEIAGGQNVFADVARESVQPSVETVITRAPDVILEVRGDGVLADADVPGETRLWSALSSLPAVRNSRVYILRGQYLVVPGPRFVQALQTIARTLHPEAFQ